MLPIYEQMVIFIKLPINARSTECGLCKYLLSV